MAKAKEISTANGKITKEQYLAMAVKEITAPSGVTYVVKPVRADDVLREIRALSISPEIEMAVQKEIISKGLISAQERASIATQKMKDLGVDTKQIENDSLGALKRLANNAIIEPDFVNMDNLLPEDEAVVLRAIFANSDTALGMLPFLGA